MFQWFPVCRIFTVTRIHTVVQISLHILGNLSKNPVNAWQVTTNEKVNLVYCSTTIQILFYLSCLSNRAVAVDKLPLTRIWSSSFPQNTQNKLRCLLWVLCLALPWCMSYLVRFNTFGSHLKEQSPDISSDFMSTWCEIACRWMPQNTAIRQQAISRTYVDPDLCDHIASLGHNDLINLSWRQVTKS